MPADVTDTEINDLLFAPGNDDDPSDDWMPPSLHARVAHLENEVAQLRFFTVCLAIAFAASSVSGWLFR